MGVDGIEIHWLTEREGAMTLKPDLKEIEALLISRFSNHNGIAVFEGLEWMIDLHGARPVFSMISRLVDSIALRAWSLLLPLDSEAISREDLVRLKRECHSFNIDFPSDTEEIEPVNAEETIIEENEVDFTQLTVEDGSPRLVMLTRLSREGFTSGILRRRILQWRRMGLDVSALEPALNMQDVDDAWKLYTIVEEDVRIAVELDRRVDLLSNSGNKSAALKYRFRIRLLNNLSLVSRELEEEILSAN